MFISPTTIGSLLHWLLASGHEYKLSLDHNGQGTIEVISRHNQTLTIHIENTVWIEFSPTSETTDVWFDLVSTAVHTFLLNKIPQ